MTKAIQQHFEHSSLTIAIIQHHKPPFEMLYLRPKSSFIPPALCEAVSISPPSILYLRMMCEVAGVDRTQFCPITTLETCSEKTAETNEGSQSDSRHFINLLRQASTFYQSFIIQKATYPRIVLTSVVHA